MKLKTIFMGTPNYVMHTIKALYENSELLGIFTGADKLSGRGKKLNITGPKSFALKHDIPVFQPNTFKGNHGVENQIKLLEPDLIVVNAYGFILPNNILSIAKLASVNLHGSILPKYRGASPIHYAILNGDKSTGITAQIMVQQLDAGDIIHKIETPIYDEDDYYSLSERLSLISAECIKDVLSLFIDNRIIRVPQDHNEVSFCKKITKVDGIINWNDEAKTILNKVRAYIKWPKSITYYKGKKIIIHKLAIVDKSSDKKPGTIIKADKHGLYVQCRGGMISILSLQLEGKKELDFISFLNGNHWKVYEELT